MIIPQYWSEAKLKKRINDRTVTIRRFGWSDASEQDARQQAEARAAAAMAQVESGQDILRRERKIPYNGADGMPIREEIISRHRDSVITRNSYGALCINTPDVLFADIDFASAPGIKHYALSFLLLFIVAIVAAILSDSLSVFGAASLGAFAFAALFTARLNSWLAFLIGSEQEKALKRIRQFSAKNPDWHLRIYRTPAGYRVLAMHKTFDPEAAETLDFFRQLHSDPVYVQMCKNQRCFRARVSPKPWRIGIDVHMKPQPGVWPIKPERMAERKKWVSNYEKVADQFASCRFEERLGSDRVDASAEYIRALHDEFCRAESDLALG